MDKTINQLVFGINECFENAQELYNEALILSNNNSFARSLVLHQISLEECAKLELIGYSLTNYILTGKINIKNLQEKFNHKTKNYTNAYFLDLSEEEVIAIGENDITSWKKIFDSIKDKFHRSSNDNKNNGLYVNLLEGEFSSPKDSITEEMVVKTRNLNEKILKDMATKLSMVKSWEKDPLETKETIESLNLEKIAKESSTAEEAFCKLLNRIEEIANKPV